MFDVVVADADAFGGEIDADVVTGVKIFEDGGRRAAVAAAKIQKAVVGPQAIGLEERGVDRSTGNVVQAFILARHMSVSAQDFANRVIALLAVQHPRIEFVPAPAGQRKGEFDGG